MSSVSMVFVGKKRFLKKDKSGYCCKVYYISEFSDEEKEEGCIGSESGDSFVSEECWHAIKPENVGQRFQFLYAMGKFKRAEVVGLEFIDESK